MKRISSLLFSLLMIVLPPTFLFGQEVTKDYTFMIYLNGSDLQTNGQFGTLDMDEMTAAISTDFVHLIVVTGGSKSDGWKTLKAWHLEKGKKTELTNFNPFSTKMNEGENLTRFINFAVTNYPAEKHALVLWNHGGALRGYGWDEVTDKQMKIPDIKQAIANSDFIKGGKKFELLGFDACLMATLEMQASVKGFAKYYVASEETEPGHGWNYTPIINAIEGGDDGSVIEGDSLGRAIVHGYKAQAKSNEWQSFGKGLTLSVVDFEKTDDVISSLEALFTKVKNDSTVQSLQKARGKAEEYGKSVKDPAGSEDMVDLRNLMEELKKENSSLSTEVNAVIAAVDSAVVENLNDTKLTHASGISIFVPHDKFANKSKYLQEDMNAYYNPIDFSPVIKNFIKDTYIPFVQGDKTPPTGTEVQGFGGGKTASAEEEDIAAILVNHANDLEQVQVIVIEESAETPEEFIVLGSTVPDTGEFISNEAEIFAYFWDEQWLGINGFPAYIADIHKFDREIESEEFKTFTRVRIPALLFAGGGTDSRDIEIDYLFDEDFNVQLESILYSHYGEENLVVAKDRVNLKAGDKVQLVHEVFNETTGEDYFTTDQNAIFTIQNGNEDLHLEHDFLEPGDYKVGFILQDHSHNDTIIFNSKTFTVIDNSIDNTFLANNIKLYPNPSNEQFTIYNANFGGETFEIRLYDMMGRLHFSKTYTQAEVIIDIQSVPDGYYAVELIEKNKVYRNKVVIQH